MKTILPSIIFLLIFINSAFAQCGELFISEVMYYTSNTDLNYAVEIYNPTASSISLNNYQIGLGDDSGNVTYIDFSNQNVPSQGTFVLTNDNANSVIQNLASVV